MNRAKDNPKIRFELNTMIEEILGSDHVEGVRILDVLSGETREIPADGVFIYVGTAPNAQFINGEIEADDHGYILTNPLLQTNIAGVYDIGVRPRRQGATARESLARARKY